MRVIPEHWQLATLGEVAEPLPVRKQENPAPVLTFKGLQPNGVVELSPEEPGAFAPASAGDIVFTKQGHVGGWILKKVGRIPDDLPAVHVASTLQAVRPRDGVCSKFLAYWLSSAEAYEAVQRLAGERNGLTKAILNAVPVPLPPLDEQRCVVAILEDHLSRLDISVQSLRRALSYLDSFRVALYGSAIRGAVGDLHFDVGSWRVATLDELQASGQGSITDGPFGSNLKSSHYTSSGARVIRLQNIGLGHFLDAEAYVSLEHFERLRKHEAIPGDLIVASLGDVLPRACLLPDLGEPTIVKADCIRVRLGDQVRGRWVLMAMLTQQARQWAREQLHGVGRQRLGLKAIRSFEVPAPPVSVQDEILARVDAVLSWSTSVELALLAALRRSESLRKSLLSAAFSGQLTRESISV